MSEPPCPICGGIKFTWGGIQTRIEGRQPSTELQFFTYFEPKSSVMKIVAGGAHQNKERLIARKCDGCGRVDLFTRNNPGK